MYSKYSKGGNTCISGLIDSKVMCENAVLFNW